MRLALKFPLLAVPILQVTILWNGVESFQLPKLGYESGRHSAIRLKSQQSSVISLERDTPRQIEYFQEWAVGCGVQLESGFVLARNMVDGNVDYQAVTSTGAAGGSRLLCVPGEMVMSAYQVANEYQGYIDSSLQILKQNDLGHLGRQFYLFVKILLEYEQGSNSPYYPWLEALPRNWNTAVSFDYFCMSTLPPYIKKVCKQERQKLAVFQEALKAFDYLSMETKVNEDLMKFAYNVVTTRSWPSQNSDLCISPMADFFNHDYPDNVELYFNENGDCEVYLKEDVGAGTPLTLCYGTPTNPSKLLAKYGFLNDSPATFSKLLFTNPSERLKEVGYDPDRLVFFTDGGVSQEVWDVILFSKLERTPGMAEAKNAFYKACMSGDEETKFAIHSQYQEATCNVLLEHVEGILKEVAQLTTMMEKFRNEDRHPRLPLLLRHHSMVASTFSKVRENILSM